MAAVNFKDIYKSFPARKDENAGLGKDQSTPKQDKSGQVVVLKRINLDIQDGEFMVLVGPSGCGKSTLLRLIAGLDDPTGGEIRVGDRVVNGVPPKDRDIAMVFQSYALYPHMNVFDNLAFGLRRTSFRSFDANAQKTSAGQQQLSRVLVAATRSLPKAMRYQSSQEKAIASHVQQVAGMLQIDGLLNRLPKQLSGGQKQRVALGRAMARNPQVFLMDEPLSNLDAKLRAQTRAQIVKLQKQLGTTTIYVTHDQTEAMTMGDRIAVMNEGLIQQLASPLELYNTPANRFVAGFIGSPPMNFIRMQVQDTRTLQHPQFEIELPHRWQSVLGAWVGQSVDLGVRPEHLAVGEKSKASMPIEVELVEALGHETYLSFSIQSDDGVSDPNGFMNARVSPEHGVAVGDRLSLTLDLAKLHLFEADSGTAIAPES